MNKINSIGKFSSSQIYRLMGSKKVAQTYIEEKNIERVLMRKLQNEQSSRATSWGNMMEGYAFEKLPIEYKLCSKETLAHPEYGDFWVGTPDVITPDSVGDIKNPFTLKSFFNLVNACQSHMLLEYEDSYFWQLVSNAIITRKSFAELIVHAPYEDEFSAISEYYNNYENKKDMAWFEWLIPEEIPLLKKESGMKDINIVKFTVGDTVREQLTINVLDASKKLISIK